MRKFRLLIVLLVIAMSLVGAASLMVPAPSPNPAANVPALSYNPGASGRYHAPLSSMGVVAINQGAQPIPRGTDLSGAVTPTPSLASIPVDGIRFINDTSYIPQSETTIAVDPANTNHVVGGVNDARFFFCSALPASDCPDGSGFALSGFTVSSDGGRSVLRGDVLPDLVESVRNATGVPQPELMISWGDPSIVPGVNGNFYYASLSISASSNANGIELAVSNSNLFSPTADCTTSAIDPTSNSCWSATFVAGNLSDVAPTFEDKELVSVDRDATSPFYGDAYVSWDHFTAVGTSESWLARCSPALSCTMLANETLGPLSGSDPYAGFTTPSVGTDGAVHVTWCNFGTATTLGPISCRVRSSAPNGGAFGTIHDILSFDGAGTTLPSYTGLTGFATEQFRTADVPVLAADTSQTSNNLYFTIDACSAGNYYNFYGPAFPGNCGESSILFSRSTDGGATWSTTPAVLSGSGVNVQPWVTVDPLNGAVVVAYYTTRFDSFNHRIDVVADVSTDQGVTFHTVRVTNVSNEPNSDPSMYDYLAPSGFGGSFVVPQYGDYMQVAALGGELWVSYTANYAVELGTFQTDPWLTLAAETGPLAVAATATPNPTDPGVGVSFQAAASNPAGPATYAWTFGDGSTGTGANPTHTYTAAGTYTAEVTATDVIGRTAASQVPVTITTALTAQLAATPTATDAGLAVSFTATPAGGSGTYTYAWAFGDGASSSSATSSHSYANAGTYTVTLWVNDSNGGSAREQTSVTVNPAPAVSATASASAVDVGQAVSFTGTLTGGTSPRFVVWDFGDGSTSVSIGPVHVYGAPSTYAVHFTMTDAAGGSATTTLSIAVSALPSVSASASPYSPQVGSAVDFTASASGGTGTLTYTWAFGDGATSASQNPSHTYTSAGTYLVHLWANDTVGGSSLTTVTIVVVAQPAAAGLTTETGILYAVVALIVGVVLGMLVMLLVRRRKGGTQAQEPPKEGPS